MKILVLSPKPPWPPHDGGAVATMRCIEGLAANGAKVSVLAMRTRKHPLHQSSSVNRPAFTEHYQTVNVDTRIRPVRMLINLLFSDQPYDIQRFRSQRFSKALHALIVDGNFDIIQCEGLVLSLYINDIKKFTSAPVVLRAHNVEYRIREMMAENSAGMLRRSYMKNLSRRVKQFETTAVRQFDAVVPISEPDSQWFRSISTGRPVVLSETGAETAEHLNEPAGPSMRVGFIGALDWQPNLEGIKWFLKHVWPCVCRAVPSASLHIAGRGAPAKAKRWLSGHKVSFDGEVDDARSYMASMHVIIAPLFAGSGLRIKIIEAMSIGRTVVATPVAVSGLPARDRREIIIAAEPGSFCSALTKALQDPVLRTSTGEAAVALVQNRYNNLVRTAELLEFYKDLSHGR